ncbi:MAG: UDP-N-acetylglucosamine 2-epimerase (non-hydrolyzing) [Gammaproteobacteria bacterium]|nr:UDP-N-acetylglucosamine 2-epimerase (non-hydrolyzing) [Gammaproteobacteria bacterium]
MAQKIVSVVGARPQFVKAAVVSEQLRAAGLPEVMIHTGQHYDANMSDVFFAALGIPEPRYNLGIGGGRHGEMTGRQLAEIERCLLEERPDAVVVYGDTNSTLAGALAAVKLHIPVAHVEAGLRSFNNRMPEEINRIVTDRVSAVLFTPSQVASANLRAEGIAESRIVEVGDVMYDAALRYGGTARPPGPASGGCVVTIHRAENTDDATRLGVIVAALIELSRLMRVTFPVHPRTRKALTEAGEWGRLAAHVELTEPLGYIEMLAAVRAADVIVTDSGGLQKEAYFLETPCVTLRGETEWVETVALGWNRLVTELNVPDIVAAVSGARPPATDDARPYGDGHAAAKIAQFLRATI